MRRPLLAVALCLIAVAWIQLEAGGYECSPDGLPKEKSVLQIQGRICRIEEQNFWLDSVTFCYTNQNNLLVQNKYNSTNQKKYCYRVLCEAEGESEIGELPLGTMVRLQGEFANLRKATNPGEFDESSYYKSLGVGGKLKKIRLLSHGKYYWRIRQAAYQLRCCLRERIHSCMSTERAGVMCALLLGDKTELDKEIKELYKRNGILHIMSISSLHITILGMSLYRGIRRLGVPIVIAAAIGGCVLLFYGMMTGFSVSAIRAIGMYLIRMLGEIIGRTYDTLTALGLMALIMVLANPYRLNNAGFLLSFGAVFGMEVLGPFLGGKLSGDREMPYNEAEAGAGKICRKCFRKIQEGIRDSLVMSLSISLATLPVQLFFYHEVAIFSPVLNLLVLPCMKPLLMSGFLSMLPGLGVMGVISDWFLSFFDLVCGLFDKMGLRTWNPGAPEFYRIVIYYLVVLACVGVGRVRKCKRGSNLRGKVQGVVIWLLLFMNAFLLNYSFSGKNRITFLDVGQGDCILLQTRFGHNFLYDCGSSSRRNVGKNVLLPCLKYYGISRLDGVIISHSDKDHISGILECLDYADENRIEIRQLVLPEIAEEDRQQEYGKILRKVKETQDKQCKVTYLGAGFSWVSAKGTEKEIDFHCLHPLRNMSGADSNAYSLCLLVDFGEISCLLTGDAEADGEKNMIRWMKERAMSKITILKCAHHGSKNGTSASLLEQISPELVVISCGAGNSYGHPHREVLDRLQDAGAEVYRTDLDGAVIMTIDEKRNAVKIKKYGR